MSTRWYPLYQHGNPQLRVFLPNFWMKLIKPKYEQPPNVVMFHCSMEMTKHDIKNYLKKIYDVHPVSVNTLIALGKTHTPEKFVVKEDDVKIAFVTLDKNESFTFPDVTPSVESNKEQEQQEQVNEMQENFKHATKNNKMPGMPTWFMS